MAPPTTIICTNSGTEKEEANTGAGSSFTSTARSVESIGDVMMNLQPSGVMLTDADGDQVLAAEDERNSIFRIQQQHDIESAAAAAARGSSSLPPPVQPGDSKHATTCSDDKYPKISLNGSFDTADTEECSQASTDDGEVHLAGGQGNGFEDDEEQGQGTTTTASSPLGAKDLILQRLQAARDKLSDMLNWYTFVALSFLTAAAAILCVAFGNHGVAAILLFVAVLLITVLICWLRLDLRAVEMM